MKKFIVIIGCVLLFGCGKEKLSITDPSGFGETIKIEHTPIAPKELLVGAPVRMLYLDSTLIYSDHFSKYAANTYDLKNKKSIQQIRLGGGPAELAQLLNWSVTNRNQNEIGAVNMAPRSIKYYRLEGDSLTCLKTRELPNKFTYGCTVIDSTMAMCLNSTDDEGMFIIRDLTTGHEQFLDEYPKGERHENNASNAYTYQGAFSISPDNKYVVFSAFNAVSLKIFSVDPAERKVSLSRSIVEYAPKIDFLNGFSVVNDDNKMGMREAHCTDEYIYALYSGLLKKDKDYWKGTQLLVFDYNGNPIKRYELDVPVYSSCISPDGKTLFGFTDNPDPELIRFDL